MQINFFHLRKHYYGLWTCILARSNVLMVKCLNGFVSCCFSVHTTLIVALKSCRSLVDYCGFLSAVWTLILTAPIHCTRSFGE